MAKENGNLAHGFGVHFTDWDIRLCPDGLGVNGQFGADAANTCSHPLQANGLLIHFAMLLRNVRAPSFEQQQRQGRADLSFQPR